MAQENKSKVSILTNGIIKENPVLRLVLGTCSTLAVTTAVSSALDVYKRQALFLPTSTPAFPAPWPRWSLSVCPMAAPVILWSSRPMRCV